MSQELAGQVAIVTGAAHGFGRQICVQLGGLGAHIAACDINDEELMETGAILERAGIESYLKHVDVTDEAQVDSFVAEVIAKWGQVDILVNDAGGTVGVKWRPVDEVATADWDKIVKVNLYGPFFFTRAVAGHMKKRRHGKIVTISSGAGRVHSRTGIHAYSAAKAGVMGFTRQCAFELGRYNINVNSVAPGLIMSTEASQHHWEERPAGERETILNTVALHRLGTVEDIANAVVFLVTEAGDWVQGQTILVDGGHWMF